MDVVLGSLQSVAFGLALVLSLLALLVARRYADRRFVMVGIGLALLGFVSLLSLLALAGLPAVQGAAIGYPTTAVLLVAELMLYLSLTSTSAQPTAQVQDLRSTDG